MPSDVICRIVHTQRRLDSKTLYPPRQDAGAWRSFCLGDANDVEYPQTRLDALILLALDQVTHGPPCSCLVQTSCPAKFASSGICQIAHHGPHAIATAKCFVHPSTWAQSLEMHKLTTFHVQQASTSRSCNGRHDLEGFTGAMFIFCRCRTTCGWGSRALSTDCFDGKLAGFKRSPASFTKAALITPGFQLNVSASTLPVPGLYSISRSTSRLGGNLSWSFGGLKSSFPFETFWVMGGRFSISSSLRSTSFKAVR